MNVARSLIAVLASVAVIVVVALLGVVPPAQSGLRIVPHDGDDHRNGRHGRGHHDRARRVHHVGANAHHGDADADVDTLIR